MKNTLYLLFLCMISFLISCEDDETPNRFIDLDDVTIDIKMYIKDISVEIEVEIYNLDKDLIEECGIYWKSDVYRILGDLTLDNAIKMKQEGGKTIYYFDLFPWKEYSENILYGPNRCEIKAKAYILAGRNTKESQTEREVFDYPLYALMSYNTDYEKTDLIVNCEYNAPDNSFIEECGFYWNTTGKGEIELDYQKVVLGSEMGNYTYHLKDGAVLAPIYCLAYLKSARGEVYSQMILLRPAGGDITIRTGRAFFIPYQGISVTGYCWSDQPDIYPILEYGFCYRDATDFPNVNPNISHQVVAIGEGNRGEYSFILTNVLPYSTYKISAYATNKKKTFYSSPITIRTGSMGSL